MAKEKKTSKKTNKTTPPVNVTEESSNNLGTLFLEDTATSSQQLNEPKQIPQGYKHLTKFTSCPPNQDLIIFKTPKGFDLTVLQEALSKIHVPSSLTTTKLLTTITHLGTEYEITVSKPTDELQHLDILIPDVTRKQYVKCDSERRKRVRQITVRPVMSFPTVDELKDAGKMVLQKGKVLPKLPERMNGRYIPYGEDMEGEALSLSLERYPHIHPLMSLVSVKDEPKIKTEPQEPSSFKIDTDSPKKDTVKGKSKEHKDHKEKKDKKKRKREEGETVIKQEISESGSKVEEEHKKKKKKKTKKESKSDNKDEVVVKQEKQE